MDKSEALISLYNDIKSHTADAAVLYDKIEYVKSHGQLPEGKKAPLSTSEMDLAQINDRVRSINNVTSKTKKKLEIAKAKGANPDKVLEWELKIEELLLERETLYKRKRELNG